MAKKPPPNYFQLPNVIIDEDMRSLSESELKVLLFLYRRTKGFHRDRETLSLAVISAATGIVKSACSRACQSLEEREFIKREKHSSEDGGCSATTYAVDVEDDPTPVAPGEHPPLLQENTPVAGGERYKEERKQTERKELTPTLPSLSENPPEQPTHQDVINRINSQGPGLLGAGARSLVKSTDISGLTLDEAVVRCQESLKKIRRQAKHDTPRPSKYSRQTVQREDPKAEMESDGSYAAFREKYPGVSIDSDWEKAWPFWRDLDGFDKAKALVHIATCDPAFVKTPRNYLKDREFERPPRPAPKTEFERMMDRL